MTLTIDTRNVKNHEEVCYKPKTEEGYPYADATEYLAIGSMAIGISEITKANYKEVYARHKKQLHLSAYQNLLLFLIHKSDLFHHQKKPYYTS